MPAERSALFSDVPVRKAVLTLAVPTVISQLITVVYNMADTFFIGQLNDPLQVAATTLAMPCFMFLTAFANLFGLGGSSLISAVLVRTSAKKRATPPRSASGRELQSRFSTASPFCCRSRCCSPFSAQRRKHGTISGSMFSGRSESELSPR